MTQEDHRAENLRSLAGGALGWLHANREHAAMPPNATADLAENINDYKAIAEMAVTACVTSQAVPAQHHHARDILDFAWQQFGHGNLLYERQLRHLTLSDPVETYAHMAQAGYRHGKLEELLRHVHQLTAFKAAELYPDRYLAVANAQRLAGLPYPREWSDLAARTWLGQSPEPWAIDWDDAYSLTHTVFHLTDWGRRPLELPHMVTYLKQWLPVWLDAWSESQEWDLVAELLFVDACLPDPDLPTATWERLTAVQGPSGFVPRKGISALPDTNGAADFRRYQHTTCVTAMAAAMAANRTRAQA